MKLLKIQINSQGKLISEKQDWTFGEEDLDGCGKLNKIASRESSEKIIDDNNYAKGAFNKFETTQTRYASHNQQMTPKSYQTNGTYNPQLANKNYV